MGEEKSVNCKALASVLLQLFPPNTSKTHIRQRGKENGALKHLRSSMLQGKISNIM